MRIVAAGPVAALLVAALLMVAAPTRAENPAPYAGMVTVDTGKPFEPFVEAFAKAITANGFNVVGIACANCAIKGVFGETVPGNRVFLFFKPAYARRMLAASVAAGIEAPIRVYATEAVDGTARVTYRQPSAVFGAYEVADLTVMGRELDEHVARMVADARAGS
ncbi:MAG: DUF302 domain-containing protein [Thalassobaculum sp.]|uniref:DUF302 domain-containing protein n=1 Tax=Thalassobaculum sp. TaxID=2022740 RepID=UPI0032EF2765